MRAQDLEAKLETQSELLMALEMLTVEQTCRMLALESIVVHLMDGKAMDIEAIKRHIADQAPRYQKNFEGSGLSGFIERAQGFAKEFVSR